MAEKDKKQAAPVVTGEDDTGRHMVAAVLFGVLLGAQWPEYFLLAAIIGIFLHQRVARNNWVSFVISLVYVPVCLAYHLIFSRVAYFDIASVNSKYFVTALVVAFIATIFTTMKKSWIGFLVLFLAVLPGLFITNTQQPVLFAAFLLMVPLVYFIKPFDPAHSLLVFVAVLNSFLAAGVVSVYMASPPFPDKSIVKRISRDDFKAKMPDVYERVTTKDRVAAAIEADREKFGRGDVQQVLKGSSSGDLYVLTSRGNGSRILVLDPKTLEIKRESFDGIAGGGSPWMDVSESRGLALVTKGTDIFTVDLKTLEWIDNISLPPTDREPRACFGANGKVFYFTLSRKKFRLTPLNDSGHFGDIQMSQFNFNPLTNGVLCDGVNGVLVAGNRYAGTVEYVTYNRLASVFRPEISVDQKVGPDGILYVGNFINHENVYIDEKRIWFIGLPENNDDFAYVDIDEMNEQEPGTDIKGKVISYFVLPKSFSRGTENTP